MALECGIVGLPNVGKSTIFSALTAAPAAAENFPFCTIDPNIGIVDLPDERLDFLASIHNPKKKTPASESLLILQVSSREPVTAKGWETSSLQISANAL